MYRLVDCDTWSDAWFEGLDPKAKLFFLYLLTNPRSTSCGAFEITPRKMAFETGLTQKEIEGWLRAWAPRVLWWPEHSIVWIRNFYRRQGNHNEKTRTNAARLVAALPIPVQHAIGKAYPELCDLADTPAIPDPYPTHQTNNEQEPENEQESEPENEHESESEDEGAAAPPAVAYSPLYEDFWAEWSTGTTKGRGSKKQAYEQWKRWGFDRPATNRDPVYQGLAAWKSCDQWQREGGRFVKHAERWLRDRGWEDPPPDAAPVTPAGPGSGRVDPAMAAWLVLVQAKEAERRGQPPEELPGAVFDALTAIGGWQHVDTGNDYHRRDFLQAYTAIMGAGR